MRLDLASIQSSLLLNRTLVYSCPVLLNHCSITAQSLLNLCSISAQSLLNHCSITAQSLLNHCSITVQSLLHLCPTPPQPCLTQRPKSDPIFIKSILTDRCQFQYRMLRGTFLLQSVMSLVGVIMLMTWQ